MLVFVTITYLYDKIIKVKTFIFLVIIVIKLIIID